MFTPIFKSEEKKKSREAEIGVFAFKCLYFLPSVPRGRRRAQVEVAEEQQVRPDGAPG